MPPSSPSFAPSFQIIVVPPAEDQQPDYLVFDAHDVPEPEQLATEPNFESLDAAFARIRRSDDPPTFSRTSVDGVVMPRRSEARPEPELADETVRDDSEIVEVVKVRRAFSQDEQPPPSPPKPKSLKSRAGSAFRSIKNLARVASRSTPNNNKPYAQEVFASSQSTQATFAAVPLPTTPPSRTRRGSIILTQLFRTPSPVVDTPPTTLDFLAGEPYSDDDEDDEHDHDRDHDRDSIAPRGPSPTPSSRTFSSTIRRRLSILSFTKGRPASPRPPSPPTLSRGSTVPSTSSLPQTPIEESYPRPPPSTKDADDDPDRTIGEMRLDSLHFESLSFDADRF
ncbi:hypothetical protein MVEN_02074900 [Mycena venus]|uniref:Uncharacterized protein n=1 Tax=Mycena venus TaxID=2733690 RepID=A0A8H7CKA8_9AGAR|nr:hypothetical protein MVEN_02074900 [Mycena venus]